MNDKKIIVVAGAGQLGSRHLQALSNLTNEYKVIAVDPSTESLRVATDRYKEVNTPSSPLVEYVTSIEELQGLKVFLAVIATSAGVRLDVLKGLVRNSTLQNVVLEKVLFQSIEQIDEAERILNEKGINAWVNCPRRQFEGYRAFRDQIQPSSKVHLEVQGTNWGLACNTIHFIDLWQFFSGFTDYTLSFDSTSKVIDSKRSSYKEVSGSLEAICSKRKHALSLSCQNDINKSVELEIKARLDEQEFLFSESEGLIKWFDKDDETSKSTELKMLFQSQLTDKVVLSLAASGDCDLTKFDVSAMLHREFLSKIIPVFTKEAKGNLNFAPIT